MVTYSSWLFLNQPTFHRGAPCAKPSPPGFNDLLDELLENSVDLYRSLPLKRAWKSQKIWENPWRIHGWVMFFRGVDIPIGEVPTVNIRCPRIVFHNIPYPDANTLASRLKIEPRSWRSPAWLQDPKPRGLGIHETLENTGVAIVSFRILNMFFYG